MSASFPLPPGNLAIAAMPANTQTDEASFSVGLGTGGGSYYIPDPRSRPRAGLVVKRFYVPIAASCQSTSATAAAVAHVRLALTDRLKVFWTYSVDIGLAGNTTGGASGNFVIADDLVNPLEIELIDQPVLRGQVAFDQAISDGAVDIGAQIGSPQAAAATIAPGVVIYELAED